MNMRRTFVVIGLAALAACGSASDALTFAPPSGYTQAASIGPFMQIWDTADKHNAMILIALPAKIDLQKAMSQSSINDADVKVQKEIKICGSQPAMYADLIGTVDAAKNGATPTKSRVEFLATNVNEKTYMAIYVRELQAPANPAAEAALKNLCAK
jgi:hypothetical protein